MNKGTSSVVPPPAGVRVPALLQQCCPPELGASVLRTLWRLPKVEVHIHLEGSLRPETVSALARQYEPHSPFCRPGWEDDYWSFHDLASFIVEQGLMGRTCIRRVDDYYRIARECFADLAAQQVLYAEVSFGPRLPGQPFYVPARQLLAAIDQARREVEQTTSLRVGLVLGLGRSQALAADGSLAALPRQWVEEALRAREEGAAVVAVDLHGDEQTLPDVGPFVSAFRLAAEGGLGRRAHAGEGGGPGVVWDSLRWLGAQRIAHGVRAVEDPALVAHLAASGVVLDVCPTSNLRLGVAADLAAHPIAILQEAGVVTTVSSDDPLPFATCITAELALLHLQRGFSLPALRQLTIAAAAHCFLPATEREALVRQVERGWPQTLPATFGSA